MNSKNKILLKGYILMMVGYLFFYCFLPEKPIMGQTYNPHPECPTNSDHIWVVMDSQGEGTLINIPFESGYDITDVDGPGPDEATGYINYVGGVLFGEVSPTYNDIEDEVVTFNDEFLRGFAMLARTVAIENCGKIEFKGRKVIDSTIKQNYVPNKLLEHPDLVDRYRQAVTDTAGQFVTHNGDVFDLQYRDISNSPTNDFDDIHRSVLDPAGIPHTHSKHQRGLPQINASHILQGVAHGAWLPRWNLCQTHAHYYNGLTFDCPHTTRPTPTDYRFNVLTMTVTDCNGGLILQNTGQQTWQLTPQADCNPTGYPNRTIALSAHWYASDGNLVEFETNRAMLCAEMIDGVVRTAIPPTATLFPLPQIITNPFVTDLDLFWGGRDVGGSGLFFDLAYGFQPAGNEPPPAPLEPQVVQTTTTNLRLSALNLTLLAGQTYQFWLRGHDGAGNLSPWQLAQTRYQPVPVLEVEPQGIERYHLVSDTSPITVAIQVNNVGGGGLSWTISSPATWIQLSQTTGVAPAIIVSTFTLPQTASTYQANLLIQGTDSTLKSPYTLPVKLHLTTQKYQVYIPLLRKEAVILPKMDIGRKLFTHHLFSIDPNLINDTYNLRISR